MNERRKFLSVAGLTAAMAGVLFPKRTYANTVDNPVGYRSTGGGGLWKPNQKYSARDGALTIHARLEAKKAGDRAHILGIIQGPSSNFTAASAAVFLDKDEAGVAHNSLCLSVPQGASFEIKLEGNLGVELVHISVFG